MGKRKFLIVGAALMILLGLARAVGGVVLLLQGGAADPRIEAPPSTVTMVGVFLITLSLILMYSAVGVLRRSHQCWLLGIFLTVAFVIGGAINGYVLYGRPGAAGTMVNSFVAVAILASLLPGRAALRKPF